MQGQKVGAGYKEPYEPGCHPDEIKAYNKTCASFEGTNVYEKLYPTDTKGQTWVSPDDPLGIKGWGQRIDHVIASQEMLDGSGDVQIADMKVPHYGSSDHWPIVVTTRPKTEPEIGQQTAALRHLRVLGVCRDEFDSCNVHVVDSLGKTHTVRPSRLPVINMNLEIENQRVLYPVFCDTGSPFTIFNPSAGHTYETDPHMSRLLSQRADMVGCSVTGVGGGTPPTRRSLFN